MTTTVPTAAPTTPPRHRRVLPLLRPALAPWVVVQLVAVTALVLVRRRGELPWAGNAPDAYGRWAWDAGWYRAIAESGYSGAESADLRFFPLFPLLGRLVGALPGLGVGTALALVASAAALGYLALLALLAQELTGSEATARRAVWLGALVPGATVLALPYTEAVAGLLAVAFFLGLQRRSPVLVAVTGLLSGAARPTGMLLAAAAAVYLVTDRSRLRAALTGVVAPLLGTASFGLWSLLAYGDAFAPYSLQSRDDLRGGLLVNPLPGMVADTEGGLPPAVTVLVLVVAAALLALAVRRLPLPYVVWSALVLLLAATSTQAHSLPRYVAGVFPLLVVAAVVLPSGRAWRVLLVALTVAGGVLTALWFADRVVP